MFKGNFKFFLSAVLLLSVNAFATVPEGEEASVLQNHLKDKKMNFCSEELKDGGDFQSNLKLYNQELGAIANENSDRMESVGTPSFVLRYNGDLRLVEIWPNSENGRESEGPILQIEPSKLDPVLYSKIRKEKNGHIEDVMVGDGQVPFVGAHGTSPALVRLLSVNLDLFCEVRNQKKDSILRSSMEDIVRSAESAKKKRFVSEAPARRKKLGPPGKSH